MKQLMFTKMQGAGNDYVYINGINQFIKDPSELALKLSNRNFGIGSDGIVILLRSDVADFRMQMFNSDGSEAEMCGNASRCIAKYAYDKELIQKKEISLETKAGIKYITLLEGNETSRKATVNMGEPILDPQLIPASFTENPVLKQPLVIDGKAYPITCVSMGNPHAVVFIEKGTLQLLNLHDIGSKIENHPVFPNRTNVEFVEIVSKDTLNMRVWERGAGETLACGTGACASLVAAVLNNLCNRKVTMNVKGGTLEVEWREADNNVYLTGDAVTVFEGIIYNI